MEKKENIKKDYCNCERAAGVFVVNGHWGYEEHCSDCKKPLEDGFHYYNESE